MYLNGNHFTFDNNGSWDSGVYEGLANFSLATVASHEAIDGSDYLVLTYRNNEFIRIQKHKLRNAAEVQQAVAYVNALPQPLRVY